jgi:hypothetical protein
MLEMLVKSQRKEITKLRRMNVYLQNSIVQYQTMLN